MGKYSDLLGTLQSKFRIGLGGPQVKNNSGVIEARDAADSAYAQMRMLLAAVTGNDVVLNEQSTDSGASWKYTLRRPATGMTHALTVVMPSGDPAPGQALTVASFAGDVITLEWSTVAGGADKLVVDTTTLAFGDASPKALFTLPASNVIPWAQVVIDTAFDGSPSLSVGISGETSKYLSSTQVDLTAVATTVFEVSPGLPAPGGSEALIATYAAGGATQGSARILIAYMLPS